MVLHSEFKTGETWKPSLMPLESIHVEYVTAGNDQLFRALCGALDLPELADDREVADLT